MENLRRLCQSVSYKVQRSGLPIRVETGDIPTDARRERESVSDYLTCMRAMFDKLTPPLTESEEISYTHRNLLPRLHLAIHRADARSFVQLEYMAMNAEKGYRVAKAYRPPPNPDRSLLPELAYYEPRSRGSDRRRETVTMTNGRVEYSAYDGPVDELYLSAERSHPNRTAAPGPSARRDAPPSLMNPRPGTPGNPGRQHTNPFVSPPDPPIARVSDPQTPLC